jgi:DNA-directed RNA polymerase specialized sigma24 family protein
MSFSPIERGLGSNHPGLFQTTHWSVVSAAGAATSTQSAVALEQLCRIYWYPLYSYVRRRGYEVEESQDLTQEFFARLIAGNWIGQVDRSKGRFRSFLVVSMNHFLAKELRRSKAARRGSGRPILSLDDTTELRYAHEPASDLTPEKLYDQRWALVLLDHALNRLRAELAGNGKGHFYEHLKRFLCREPEAGEYDHAAAALQMTSGAVATAVHRLRRRYHLIVREEVGRTVASPADVEDEMRSLMAALSGVELEAGGLTGLSP